MIYINIGEIELPDGWSVSAEQALEEVKPLPLDDRKSVIKSKYNIWKKVKKSFGKISRKKCWYCESYEKRSHMAIDHFRPKNSVEECQDHPGYWWLAFEWQNYRYCCTLCNNLKKDEATGETGGKGEHFPLLNEENRAYNLGEDIELEKPCLLDPVVASDPGLLWFSEDGSVVSKYNKVPYPRLNTRAEISIKIYHLNCPDIREARLAASKEIAKLVKDGNKYFLKMTEGDSNSEHAFKRVIELLIKAIRPSAEFSAAARATLSGYRESEWVEEVLRVA